MRKTTQLPTRAARGGVAAAAFRDPEGGSAGGQGSWERACCFQPRSAAGLWEPPRGLSRPQRLETERVAHVAWKALRGSASVHAGTTKPSMSPPRDLLSYMSSKKIVLERAS